MIKKIILFLSPVILLTCDAENLPPLVIPRASAVTVSTPAAPAASAETPSAAAIAAEVPQAPPFSAEPPKVPPATLTGEDISRVSAMLKMRDFRVFRNTKAITQKWVAISRREWREPEYIPLSPCKIAAHVQLPVRGAALAENLAFYKRKNYTGILLAFTAGDSVDELLRVAGIIKQSGFKLFITYNDKPFPDPDELRKRIITLAPLSEGLFLGYMKSYAHNHLADKWYLQFISQMARDANPKIALIGESYRGEIQDRHNQMENNTLDNVSGTLLVNAGYLTFPPSFAQRLYKIQGTAIPLIIGLSPYYIARGVDDNKALAAKAKTETRWISHGSIVTVTLHGDGDPENDNIAARRLVLK